ncbi:hypothetical protein X767_04485 [Mesorhizobium sp. LSJC264A00]|nr:hypothetical protein X767_04485 [Mesorhizobium sp. LSJC264A00]
MSPGLGGAGASYDLIGSELQIVHSFALRRRLALFYHLFLFRCLLAGQGG